MKRPFQWAAIFAAAAAAASGVGQTPTQSLKKKEAIAAASIQNPQKPNLLFPNERENYHAVMGHNPQYGLDYLRLGQISRSKDLVYALGNKIYGCDVSQWQGDIDWNALKNAVTFVMIRASRGAPDPGETASMYKDSKLDRNRVEAESRGVEIGFYHYAYPQLNSARAEADCFCDNIGSLKENELAVLDMEETWGGDKVGWCRAWLDRVQERLGVKPLLYINLSTARGYDWSRVISGDYGLWLAYWDFNRDADPPQTPWPFVAMRQYSDREHFAGIGGNVDGDVFYGDLEQMKRYGFHGHHEPHIHWLGYPEPNWYRSNEHFTYHADGDGTIRCHEIIDGNEVASYETRDGYVNLQASPGNGWHEIWATATSGYGDASTDHRFAGYDVSAPGVRLTSGVPQNWYGAANAPTIKWWIDEPGSQAGARHQRMRWDGNGYSGWAENPNGFNGNHHRDGFEGSTALIEGKHALYVQAEDDVWNGGDHSGNVGEYAIGEFWLDTGSPNINTLQMSPVSPTNKSDVQISVDATDSLSGVHHVDVVVDGKVIGTFAGRSGSVTWHAQGESDGAHDVYAAAYDVAGNFGTGGNAKLVIDRGVPTVSTPTFSPGSPSGASLIQVNLSASDAVSGIKSITLVIDGKAKGTVDGGSGHIEWKTDTYSEGAHSIFAYAMDNAGNRSANSSTVSFVIARPKLYSLTLSPATIVGGNNGKATVKLASKAPSGGLSLPIRVSDSAVLPSGPCVIAAGATTGTVQLSTKGVDTTREVLISVSYGGSTKGATLVVNPAKLKKLTLSPNEVAGGVSSRATVELNGKAGPSGFALTLGTSNQAAAWPENTSLTLASGKSLATFTVKTASVARPRTVSVSATKGASKVSASITVLPPKLISLSLSPTSVKGGTSVTGTVKIDRGAPAEGLVVLLTSSDGSAKVPSSVRIAAGAKLATFTITTKVITTRTTATLTASSNGVSKTATLTITP